VEKKIKIGIITEGFIEWPGGIEFLRYILLGLRNQRYEISLLIPDRNNLELKLKNLIKKSANIILKKKYTLLKYPLVNETYNYLKEYLSIGRASIYKSKSDLIKLINQCDLVLPAFYPLDKKLTTPVIGYLYDFQYKYFPEYFSSAQIDGQNEHFSKHIKQSKDIIVNAYDVKNDIEKFYNRTDSIHVIPFTPIFDFKNLSNIPEFEVLDSKYRIGNKPYFLISNQFWPHKGHKTAFEALIIGLEKLNLDFNIVCTGRFPDTKNVAYCQELENFIRDNNLTDRIKLLGFIDKLDQVGLMLNSCALLQPTQFEGGPGGFSVYEAIGYHHPCLISDIAVNREISANEHITFFKVNDAVDLANKMKVQLGLPKNNVHQEQLRRSFEANELILTEFWTKLIDDVLKRNAR